jgi:hypothetical protein
MKQFALMKIRKISNVVRKIVYRVIWHLYPFKKKRLKSKLIWITQYYNAKDHERQVEIDETLLLNARNPWIEKIILFTNALPPTLARDEIELINSSERLHFGEILAYISRQRRNSENVYCITNSDIVLTDDILNIIPHLMQRQLIALTRWEPDNGLSYRFLPEIMQDTWILRDADLSDIVKSMGYIPLGVPGCDNRFSRVMHDSGFIIWNPCLNIKTFHNHKSEKRTYTINSRINGAYMFPLECTKEEFFLKIKRRFIITSRP